MAELSDRDKQQFIEWIYRVIQQHYKKGFLWKARLRWKMVRHWNSRWSNGGIPANAKRVLGENGATKLFQEISEDIITNPDLLWAVVNDKDETQGLVL